MHIKNKRYFSLKYASIGSDNGLSPVRRQAIIWGNAGSLSFEPLGINFSEIYNNIQQFSFKNTTLEISSAKCRPFCLDLSVDYQLFRKHPFRNMDKHPLSHQCRIDTEWIVRINVYSRNSVCKLSAIISVWPEMHSIKTGSLYIVNGRHLEYIACWEIIYYKILYYAEQSISSRSYCRCLLRYAPECISSIFQWSSKPM